MGNGESLCPIDRPSRGGDAMQMIEPQYFWGAMFLVELAHRKRKR
jgi:hypothetical protein